MTPFSGSATSIFIPLTAFGPTPLQHLEVPRRSCRLAGGFVPTTPVRPTPLQHVDVTPFSSIGTPNVFFSSHLQPLARANWRASRYHPTAARLHVLSSQRHRSLSPRRGTTLIAQHVSVQLPQACLHEQTAPAAVEHEVFKHVRVMSEMISRLYRGDHVVVPTTASRSLCTHDSIEL